MQVKNSSDSSNGGVIVEPSSSCKNKKQVSPKVAWCFTLNNYSDEQIASIISSMELNCRLGFFNKEIAPSTGTPHLQGYFEFKEKMRPVGIFKIPEMHFTGAKGNLDQNFKYCSKEADNGQMTFSIGKIQKTKLRVIETLRPWQAACEYMVMYELDERNDRTINWIVDRDGGAGKTQFCKYMSTKIGQLMIITAGAYKDIACCLNLAAEDWDLNDPTVIFYNLPRDSDDRGLLSYKALESLKDGMMTSTKYESKTMMFNSPSVWVFSNNMPSLEKLSKDRWKVWSIQNNELHDITDEHFVTNPFEDR